MLTVRADILKEKPKKDGGFNIRIRFTHNRKVKRLPTKLYVTKEGSSDKCVVFIMHS